MNQICKQCGIEYDAKRSDSLYCSKKCRVYAGRISATVPSSELSATPEKDVTSVTLSDGQILPLDLDGRKMLEDWHLGKGTSYQQQLGTLSLQYDYLRGSARAKACAAELLFSMLVV